MFDMLINYDLSNDFAKWLGDIRGCPVHRRILTIGLPAGIKPHEIISVERWHWNNNLRVNLINGSCEAVLGDWAIDFLSPVGNVMMTLKRDNFKN
jgi:hypothetical protein